MSFLQRWLTDFIRAYDNRTDAIRGGNLQILSMLIELEERLEEHMATDEATLQQILNKVSAVEVGVNELKAQVTAAQDRNPALADEFSGINETLDRISGVLSSSAPAPTPEPTPVPEPTEDPEG